MRFHIKKDINTLENKSYGQLIFSFPTYPFYRWFLKITNSSTSSYFIRVQFYNKRAEMVNEEIVELTSGASKLYSSGDTNIDGIDLIVVLFEMGTFTRATIEAGGE